MKIFIIFFLIVFLCNENAESHGPSRQKVSHKIEIDSDINNLWNIIKNFKEFQWNPEVKKSKAENNEIGSERTIEFKTGEVIVHKLQKKDDEKKMIGWRVIKTDNNIFPVNSYSAKITIKEISPGKSSVNYKAGFYRGFMGNDPPDELNDENSKKKVSNFIKNSLNGLKKIAENN